MPSRGYESHGNTGSPKSTLCSRSPRSIQEDSLGYIVIDNSIEQLYANLYEMQSSDGQSPSRRSFISFGDESRIDSELRHLVGGEMRELEIMGEEIMGWMGDDVHGYPDKNPDQVDEAQSVSSETDSSRGHSKEDSSSNNLLEASAKKAAASGQPPIGKRSDDGLKGANGRPPLTKKQANLPLAGPDAALDNPELGPFLLKQARGLISSGDNHRKALHLALRAAKSFEICANGKPSLELVMSLYAAASIHCSLGQYEDAILILERSIGISSMEESQDYALAKFSGHIQLGDTYAMLGQLEKSLLCYTMGLEVQKRVLGEKDPQVGETCRYLAEAHLQAMKFDEAEKLCQMALDTHQGNGSSASLEEATCRRLMGLICETKGDREAALEHLVLASMAMVANGQEAEVASVDSSIGDIYLSLGRYGEAVFAYRKALAAFKSSKGQNHPSVASVLVRLADLYHRTGKLRESKSSCDNALRIYMKPFPRTHLEEIASGLTRISALYESMNDLDQALKLLQNALNIHKGGPGHQQNTVAGIEAQMGILHYMSGNYAESYSLLKSAASKLRANGEKKSAFLGIVLNQTGLTCVQKRAVGEALELFEEAKKIFEQEYGPCHPDTLGVYSNLAATYDAVGRLDEAIDILEYVVEIREEKLGTANPEVDDERKRLAELLKAAGKVHNRKVRSLETLLISNPQPVKTGILV